jgi:hypothetical protein
MHVPNCSIRILIVAIGLLLINLLGCGGSGGVDPIPNPNNELLNGEYVEAAAWDEGSDTGEDGYGIYDIEHHGDGTADYGTLYDTNDPNGSASFSYDINDNGTLTAEYDGKTWQGIVSRDGDIVVYVSNGAMEA